MLDVVLLSPLPPPVGGIAKWSETLVKFFKDDYSINLIHVNTSHNVETIVGRNLFQRYVGSFFQIFSIKRMLKNKLKCRNVKVAHMTTSGGFGVIRDYILINFLKSKNIKIVYHLHFGKTSQILKSNGLIKKIFESNLNKVSLIMAMDFVTLAALDDYQNKTFCPNPIEEIDFSYTENEEIVFLGYVVKSKGIEELLEAWNMIYPENRNWKLRIVGACNSEYKTFLEEQYSPKGVVFMGEKTHSEAMNIMKKASILVLPSYSEGFPYAICEAMFAGKAIIGTDVGAIPYLLGDNCGLICQKANSKSLEEKLLLFIKSEEERYNCAKNARKKAMKEIEASRVCEMYAEIWRNL